MTCSTCWVTATPCSKEKTIEGQKTANAVSQKFQFVSFNYYFTVGVLLWFQVLEILLDRGHNSIRTHTICIQSRALVLSATINHPLLTVLCSVKHWLWRQFISYQLFSAFSFPPYPPTPTPPQLLPQSALILSFHLTKTDSCMRLIKKLALTRGKMLAAAGENQWHQMAPFVFVSAFNF